MTALKIMAYIGFILAAILILFGVLFILGSGSPEGQPGWLATGSIMIVIGLIIVAGGFGIVYYARRKSQDATAESQVTLKIDLPGDINLETMKCKSCGGVLSPDNISMVAGAPVVNCPYCKTSYQITEEPKW